MSKSILLIVLIATATFGGISKTSHSAPQKEAGLSNANGKSTFREALSLVSRNFGVKTHLEILIKNTKKDSPDATPLWLRQVELPEKYTLIESLQIIQRQVPGMTWKINKRDVSVIVSLGWSGNNPLDKAVGFDENLTVPYRGILSWLSLHNGALSVGPTLEWDGRHEYDAKVLVKVRKTMTYRQVLEQWFRSANLNWEVEISTPLPRIEVREASTKRVLSVGKWPKGKSSLAIFSAVVAGNQNLKTQTFDDK